MYENVDKYSFFFILIIFREKMYFLLGLQNSLKGKLFIRKISLHVFEEKGWEGENITIIHFK